MQAKLEVARVDLAAVQVKGKAFADAATARAEADKTTKEELKAGFFQGYINLKRRTALDHPKWDLTAYSGADTAFWEMESPAAEETPVGGEVRKTKPTDQVVGETDIVVIEASA